MPASSSSRSMPKASFSESPSDVTAPTNPSPQLSAQSLHFRDDHRLQPDAQPTHDTEGTLHDRGSLTSIKEAAVQSPAPFPPSPCRSRWASSRSPHLRSSTKNPIPAQPRGPPAVVPENQPSEAWNFRRSRPDSSFQSSNKSPLFSRKLPPTGSSSSSDRLPSADSWRMASDARGKTSDQPRSADTAPSPLNLTKGTHSAASRYPGSTVRTQRIDHPSGDLPSSSSSVAPSATSAPSPAVGSSVLRTSGRAHSPWRETGFSHSAGLFPAFALSLAPPSAANVQPPAFSPPPPSSSDSHSVKSFQSTSSTTSASRRRGKRSKHHKDGKASEVPASSPGHSGSL